MMRDNIGNILKVIRETGCDIPTAEEALANSNSWPDVFKYAREKMQENETDE